MKLTYSILLLGAVAVTARPNSPDMRILRDQRLYPKDGVFSFEFETEDGIIRSESGNKELVRTGVVSFPLPNGEQFTLKFVANELGYYPESPFLPVAPVFPHPIPPHALRQIERGERERAERRRLQKSQNAA